MQVAQYLFQSPYSSPIQVGRLDPSSVKDTSQANTKDNNQPPALASQQQQLKELQISDKAEKSAVKPIVPAAYSLNIYV